MFGEIIKLLADEPEKIEKAIFRTIKAVLSIIIAERLFRLIVGPYTYLAFDSYTDWLNFILSGHLLICLFFYFSSSYVLIPVIHFFGNFIANIFTKVKVKLDTGDYRRIFKTFDIVRYRDDNEVPLPGKNISILYNLSEAMGTEGVKEEIDSFKNTFIGNVLNVYSVFLFVYFIFFDHSFRTPLQDWLVVIGFLLAVFLYAIIHGFFEYMLANYQLIISSLAFVKAYHTIQTTLASYGIFPVSGEKGSGLTKHKVFMYKEKEYVLVFILRSPKELNIQERVERFLSKRAKGGRRFIVTAPSGILDDVDSFMLKHFDNMILIEYADEKSLEAKLRQTISSL